MRRHPHIAGVAITVLGPFLGSWIVLAAENGDPIWRVPLESLSQTRERPLFSRTRRPPPKSIAAPIAIEPPAPTLDSLRLSLLGVVLGPNEYGVAVLREAESQIVKRVQVGDSINRWTLIEVRRREAVFQRDGATVTFEMPKPGAAQANVSEPAAATPRPFFPAPATLRPAR